MSVKNLSAIPVLFALSACGGGGGNGQDFASLGVQGANLLADYGNEPATQVADMPGGSFNYSGVAAFNFGDYSLSYVAANAEVLAEANLQANFGADAISGSLTNFVDADNIKGEGRIDLRNGVISGNQFSASGTGSVTYAGDPLVAQGSINGVFVGDSAQALIGEVDATFGGAPVSGLIGATR